MGQTTPLSPKRCEPNPCAQCVTVPWDGTRVPRVPPGAAAERDGQESLGAGGRRRGMARGSRGMSPRGAIPACPGVSRRSPRMSGVKLPLSGSPGLPRPYLLPASPPRRAHAVAGSSSVASRLLLCFQQLPRDEAEQRGQLAVGPQLLRLEGAAAERAGGAGPPRAVPEDAAPAEAVVAAREPHGLREELQAAGALQLQPLQLQDGGHGPARPGAQRPRSFDSPGPLLRCREWPGRARSALPSSAPLDSPLLFSECLGRTISGAGGNGL